MEKSRERREAMAAEEENEFHLRYYVGHKGKFGHEFLEFEFRSDGKLRYANNSNYKNDTMIRKEVFLTPAVLKECKRIVSESEVLFSLFHVLRFASQFFSFTVPVLANLRHRYSQLGFFFCFVILNLSILGTHWNVV